MALPSPVKRLIRFYEGETPGVRTQLVRLLMHGRLGGTGRLLILPIDQGFEHGPFHAYHSNPLAFDPHYHFRLAVEGGFSAYAAHLGWLEAGIDSFIGLVPLILKLNSNNRLHQGKEGPDQAWTATVNDAIRLGAIGVGLTIYPGSDQSLKMFEEAKEVIQEARAKGLLVIIWSYPRGNMSKEGERAIDTVAYGAHIAALLGAHVIKVKLPTNYVEDESLKPHYGFLSNLEDRVRHVMDCCFRGRRIVVFSGGEPKESSSVLSDARAIVKGGGHGSIMGRNSFQRSWHEALLLVDSVVKVYQTEGLNEQGI